MKQIIGAMAKVGEVSQPHTHSADICTSGMHGHARRPYPYQAYEVVGRCTPEATVTPGEEHSFSHWYSQDPACLPACQQAPGVSPGSQGNSDSLTSSPAPEFWECGACFGPQDIPELGQ